MRAEDAAYNWMHERGCYHGHTPVIHYAEHRFSPPSHKDTKFSC